jgi:hypothetical protein
LSAVLSEIGISDNEAKNYDNLIKEGKILVLVDKE